jgi:hypothetical protein
MIMFCSFHYFRNCIFTENMKTSNTGNRKQETGSISLYLVGLADTPATLPVRPVMQSQRVRRLAPTQWFSSGALRVLVTQMARARRAWPRRASAAVSLNWPASRQLQPGQNGTHESYLAIRASRPSRLQSRASATVR